MHKRNKILVMADWFAPAYKAGGPIRSVVNFVHEMGKYHNIFVYTGDRDLGELNTMQGIVANEWRQYANGVSVFYASPDQISLAGVAKLINAIQPDYVYCNSMFSTGFAIYPLLLKRLGMVKSQVVLAPRGMLKPSALAFKPIKKRLFLNGIKLLGIHKFIHFQATDMNELECIKYQFGQVKVTFAPNFPGAYSRKHKPVSKQSGFLRLIFVGRIHPVKNLHFLLEMLALIQGKIELTVIGNREDEQYFEQCMQLAARLPSHLSVSFLGERPHDAIADIIESHHALALPTRGENFGHAIYEALSLGRPVVISDQTPWTRLEAAGVGWDICLDRPESFKVALQCLTDMSQESYDKISENASDYARKYRTENDVLNNYLKIFPVDEN